MGQPRYSTPMDEAKTGSPFMKLVVPSRGSSTQRMSLAGSSDSFSSLVPSSPRIPCSGKRLSISAVRYSWVSLSAAVTGSRSCSSLNSTSIFLPKCPAKMRPAPRAISTACCSISSARASSQSCKTLLIRLNFACRRWVSSIAWASFGPAPAIILVAAFSRQTPDK